MKKPLVSVLMPFYDDGKPETRKYCREAIGSILAQTYRNFEIVLVVSGKREFAENEAKRSKKIRMFWFAQRANAVSRTLGERINGLVRARNLCLKKARGRYVAVADCDDISKPERMEIQVQALEQNRNVGVLGSSMTIINALGEEIGVRRAITGADRIKDAFLFFNPIFAPTVMVRKAVLMNARGYRNILGEDYDLWARLSGNTEFMNMEPPLVKYRTHTGSGVIKHRISLIMAAMGTKRLAAEMMGRKIGLQHVLFNYLQLLAIPIAFTIGEKRFERLVRSSIMCLAHKDRFMWTKRIIRQTMSVLFYPVLALTPKNEGLWVFGNMGDSFSENSRHFYEYILRKHKNIEAVWVTTDHAIFEKLKKEGSPVCMMHSLEWAIAVARARVFIFSGYKITDIGAPTTRATLDVQLWHGMPLKKLGSEERRGRGTIQDFVNNLNNYFPGFYRLMNNQIDLTIAINQEEKEYLADFFGIESRKACVTGYPRNDIVLAANRKAGGKRKRILYAPTFRYKKMLSELFDQYRFDFIEMEKFLKKRNAVLEIRPHCMDRLNIKERIGHALGKSRNIILNTENDIYPRMNEFDMLITDYSSIFIDYLLLNRPIIFAPFDIADYEKSPGFRYKYGEAAPGPKAMDWRAVIRQIDLLLKYPGEYSRERQRVCNRFHKYRDSGSSERVYKEITRILGGRK